MTTPNLNSLNSILKQIEQFPGGPNSSNMSGSGIQTYNDIAWFANSINSLGQGATPEQKANFLTGLFNKAFSLLETLSSNEAQTARKEVKAQTSKAEKLNQKSQELQAVLEGDLSDIQANIKSQTEIVNEAQGLLNESQDNLQEKQKEIEEKVSKIEKNKAKLTDPSLSTDEKLEILEEIQGFVTSIAGLGEEIKTITDDVNSLASAVKDTVEDIEKSTDKLAKTNQEGLQQLADKANEATTQVTEVGNTATTGVTNKTQEVALDRAADNATTSPSLSIKLRQSANDQGNAAESRLGSIATNLATLSKGIGNMNNAAQILATFQNAIGGDLQNYATTFENFEGLIQPTIESLGSFTKDFVPALNDLNGCVEDDIETLNSSKVVSATQSLPENETQNISKPEEEISTTDKAPVISNVSDKKDSSQDDNKMTLKTPEFEMKPLKFGL